MVSAYLEWTPNWIRALIKKWKIKSKKSLTKVNFSQKLQNSFQNSFSFSFVQAIHSFNWGPKKTWARSACWDQGAKNLRRSPCSLSPPLPSHQDWVFLRRQLIEPSAPNRPFAVAKILWPNFCNFIHQILATH